jgi:hypothetical protein
MYQLTIRNTKWLSIIPNGDKLYQHFPFQGHPKYTQIGFWVRKYTIWQHCLGHLGSSEIKGGSPCLLLICFVCRQPSADQVSTFYQLKWKPERLS